MEKIEQTTTAPTNEVEATDKVKVVIMGSGPAPKALRDAIPDEVLGKLRSATRAACQCHEPVLSAEKLKGEPLPSEVEKVMRDVAYKKLREIAASHGLGFNEQELGALYTLSLAFNPSLAIAVANAACRKFLNHWGN